LLRSSSFFARIAAASVAVALTVGPLPAAAESRVLANVDGAAITEEDLRIAAETLGQELPPDNDPQRIKMIVDFLIDMKLLAAAAANEKIGEAPDFERRMAVARDRMLMDRYLIAVGDRNTDEASLRASYAEYLKGQRPQEEVRARHILVETEDAAKGAVARLAAGEDFAKVATEISKDPGSGPSGGDLGFFTKDRMVPEFGEAAFALKPGETSGIVKSQFGFHIIKLEERREVAPPTYEQVAAQWKQYVQRRNQQELVMKLRQQARIERFDAPPAAPATTPAPTAPEAPKQ
jgi:peptidyl-prolyl cis-trans isomerase C